MKKFLIKDNKNYCSGIQITRNGNVGTLLLTIDNKVLFVTDGDFEDITNEYIIAERDGCGC